MKTRKYPYISITFFRRESAGVLANYEILQLSDVEPNHFDAAPALGRKMMQLSGSGLQYVVQNSKIDNSGFNNTNYMVLKSSLLFLNCVERLVYCA
jgi:hypothetical protein